MLRGTQTFGISQHMQGLYCFVGQSVVYEEGCKLFKKLMDIEVVSPQIQRVCLHYGKAIDTLVEANCEAVIPRLPDVPKPSPLYVMVDGCMLFTRTDKWKELKLGRIFYDSQVVDIQTNRREVLNSVYVSHFGSVDDFFPKFERHLTRYENKVIIGDGATWIWNWADDNYPGATQILDFYHAKEKLVIFAKHQFKDAERRIKWVKEQSDKLLNNEMEEVLLSLKSCRARSEEAKLAKHKTINYYLAHDERMHYKTYREKGLMIGSGPIEAAHRSVIQQRLKLSGQKWSVEGGQAIANLRCYNYSKAWKLVEKIIAAAA